MSNLFARLKRRDKRQPEPLKVTTTADTTTSDGAASPQRVDPPPIEIESPKFAVETESIFKGLKLSAQAAHTERSDSPYLRRAEHGDDETVDSEENEGESNETSSFSFLQDRQGKEQHSDSEKSSSDEQTSSSGFAFLNVTPASPTEIQQDDDQQRDQVGDLQEKQQTLGEKSGQNDASIDSKNDAEAKRPSSDESSVVMSPLQPTTMKEEKPSLTSRSPVKMGGGRMAGRQAPPVGGANKKKKKKAVRPGQSTSTSQAKQENISSSKSDLSSRTNDDSSPSHQDNHSEASEQSEQLIEIAASPRNDGEQEVDDSLTEEITTQASPIITTESSDIAMVTEVVVTTATDVQKEPMPEPVAIETADEAAESRALEEVFGNYRVKLSGEESYTALIESYQSSIKRIRDGGTHGEGEETHAKVMERQLSSVEQLISQRVEMQRLKEEEAKALNDEDYEQAEQLSKKLEQMALLSEWDIAENGLNALRDWMSQCAEVSENERDLRTSVRAELTQLKEEQSKSLQELNKQLASLKNKEKMRVQALQDKIDRDKGHIALDRQHLERSEAKLQEEVENRAAQPLAARAELEEKLSRVESEIKELECKLIGLRKEKDQLREGIAAEEISIAAVREELSAEQLQLDKEKQQIEARDAELKKEEEKLSQERHTMAATLLEEETKRDSLARVVELAGGKCAELAGVNETLEELLSQLQPLVDDCREKMKPSQHITSLQEQCSSCALEVEKMSNEVLATQTKLTALTKKMSDDELQLQQLTDAKQAAVTGRQFKEAGRLATESKALSAKLEEERSEVKSTRSRLDELNKILSDLSEQLSTLRQDTSLQEKKEDEEHIERLNQWTNQLRERREDVRGTALEEVLEKWCQLNQLLRESLSTKHGLTLTQSHQTNQRDILTEERTPGVGREEEGEEEGGEERKQRQEERAKLEERLSAIEAELEKACQEEQFDKAAELDEELQTVKKLLEH